jgi:hypothetical protein
MGGGKMGSGGKNWSRTREMEKIASLAGTPKRSIISVFIGIGLLNRIRRNKIEGEKFDSNVKCHQLPAASHS